MTPFQKVIWFLGWAAFGAILTRITGPIFRWLWRKAHYPYTEYDYEPPYALRNSEGWTRAAMNVRYMASCMYVSTFSIRSRWLRHKELKRARAYENCAIQARRSEEWVRSQMENK